MHSMFVFDLETLGVAQERSKTPERGSSTMHRDSVVIFLAQH